MDDSLKIILTIIGTVVAFQIKNIIWDFLRNRNGHGKNELLNKIIEVKEELKNYINEKIDEIKNQFRHKDNCDEKMKILKDKIDHIKEK